MMTDQYLHIIGGGLAGSEAAWQAAEMGVQVILHEMRPLQKTDVHKSEKLAELVCSNSFRSDDDHTNAVGVLHTEMRMLNSLIMKEADIARVPAGSALAVDRDIFADNVQTAIENHQNIEIKREEITAIPLDAWKYVIMATGPLTSPALSKTLGALTGEDNLAFFDAIAPIIHTDTIDMNIAWFQSRYDKASMGGDGKDYINCPLNKQQYESFIDELLAGEYMSFHEFEKNTPYFDGCMPIEVMAMRGRESLRFGPMKPVGLTNSHDQSRPYAVVQLRQDNKLGSLFNMVGFQTKLKYGEQTRIFRMIPALADARFARLGGLHRNSFINSPRLLDEELRLKTCPNLRFAGQITGVEGYVESAAIGGLAGKMAACQMQDKQWLAPPLETAHGALLHHITGGAMADSFQPMNINFGLFPALADNQIGDKARGKKTARKADHKVNRKMGLAKRALDAMENWTKDKQAFS